MEISLVSMLRVETDANNMVAPPSDAPSKIDRNPAGIECEQPVVQLPKCVRTRRAVSLRKAQFFAI